MKNRYRLTFILMLIASVVIAQEKKWDVSNPEGKWDFKEVDLQTDEGTWMNLDVSPDGSKITFDLLGDIYIMPVGGGKAKLLRGGLPFEVQPRFSPDGTKISFTSDAGGGDNIWIMGTDGSGAKQLTKERFRLLNNAIWHPEGNSIIARKHFTSGRSLGAGEMWLYHITGGSGLQLTKRKNDQQDVNEPSVSSDGKFLYYSEDVYPGGFFQYNKDPNKQIYVIRQYNMETGEVKTVTGGPGSAARPQISGDGKKLAFIRRVRTKTVMFIHDLETGEEWPVFDQLSKDQMEAWAIFGTYTGFNWMPGDKELIFWANGKINRLNIETLAVREIAFNAETKIKIAKTLAFKTPASPDEFTAKVIRHATTSPDGKIMAFSALGHLWSKELPNGKPKRLTSVTDHEFEPAFSPDGKEICYVTWDDEKLGAIYKVAVKGGNPVKLTLAKGIYRTPSYSRDGSMIVYQKEGGNNDQGRVFSKQTGLFVISAVGGEPKKIIEEGAFPSFNRNGDRIFYQTGGYYFGALTKELRSVDLNGNSK